MLRGRSAEPRARSDDCLRFRTHLVARNLDPPMSFQTVMQSVYSGPPGSSLVEELVATGPGTKVAATGERWHSLLVFGLPATNERKLPISHSASHDV